MRREVWEEGGVGGGRREIREEGGVGRGVGGGRCVTRGVGGGRYGRRGSGVLTHHPHHSVEVAR